MKKLYLASSWKNPYYELILHQIQELKLFYVYDFRNAGSAFNWTDIDISWESWNKWQFLDALKHPLSNAAFQDDFSHLDDCDVCVLITPCGKSSHLELGYAIGKNKITILFLIDDQRPELSYKMVDHIVLSTEELISKLKKYA